MQKFVLLPGPGLRNQAHTEGVQRQPRAALQSQDRLQLNSRFIWPTTLSIRSRQVSPQKTS